MIDMTKLESIEKLRELACDINGSEIVDHMQLYPSCVFDGAWLDSWHCEFDRVLEALEREIAEKYMELPVGADGVPIHVGDILKSKYAPKPFEVESMELSSTWTVWDKENGATRWPGECRHVKPRTVEDVLEEALYKAANLDRRDGYWPSAADVTNIVEKYAGELRMVGDAE